MRHFFCEEQYVYCACTLYPSWYARLQISRWCINSGQSYLAGVEHWILHRQCKALYVPAQLFSCWQCWRYLLAAEVKQLLRHSLSPRPLAPPQLRRMPPERRLLPG
jgi:hypothetical protein